MFRFVRKLLSRSKSDSTTRPVGFSGQHIVSDPVARLASGQVLAGDIKLEKLIDQQGMAYVWKARDGRNERDCVLKFPKEQTPSYFIRLTEECRNCQRLDHSSIVKVHGIRKISELIFCLEEEYIPGVDLLQLIVSSPNGVLAWQEVSHTMLEVLDAIAHAHSRDVFHRDLKPRNIMRYANASGEEHVKVIDFGISAAPESLGGLPSINRSVGSIPYASPDQIGGLPPHPSDDVYGFGATLYHLLTGVTAFSGLPGDPLLVIQKYSAPDPNKRLEEAGIPWRIPLEIVNVIKTCLRKRRDGKDARPSDITAISRALRSSSAPTTVIGGQRWTSKLERVRVARSPLIIIELLRLGLFLEEFCGKAGLQMETYRLRWSQDVLEKIAHGELDIAVFNKQQAIRFLDSHPSADLEIVCDTPRSMGGNCFHLLGHRRFFPVPLTVKQLRERKHLKVYVNGMWEHERPVRLVLPEADVTQIDNDVAFPGLAAFPEGLFYCGQNLRLVARQRGDQFIEVLRFQDCESAIQPELLGLTENCVVVGGQFRRFVDETLAARNLDLKGFLVDAQSRFRRHCTAKRFREDGARKILQTLTVGDATPAEMLEAIDTALQATFV